MKTLFIITPLLFIGIFFSGCVSLPKTEPAQIPRVLLGHFSSCSNLDGGVLLVLRKAGKSVVAVNIDFISESTQSWVLEGVDAFGSTLFRLEYDALTKRFDTRGAISGLMDLTTDENGHLVVDGFQIGISPEEIPCLLKMRWPKSWLSGLEQLLDQPGKDDWDYLNAGGDRTLFLRFDKPYRPFSSSRLEIRWASFAGLISHSIFADRGNRELTLSGYKDYEVYLKDIDSQ